jgi:hypothetical protein
MHKQENRPWQGYVPPTVCMSGIIDSEAQHSEVQNKRAASQMRSDVVYSNGGQETKAYEKTQLPVTAWSTSVT